MILLLWKYRCPSRTVYVLAIADNVNTQQPADSRPDLNAVPLPILKTARDNPEALWSFLLNPLTPYVEARAAAIRSAR